MKPFEIFKPGTHTSAEGETLSFADGDLEAIAAGYDPAVHHAPIVVGHPKQDAPAYGWVDKVVLRDGRLVAVPADIDTAFADLVKDGKFRKVSAAFYRPESANNPKPGSWYLRHVGFLGAAAPAVKGLKPVAFSDDGGTVFADLEFAEVSPWIVESIARMLRGMRDWLVANSSVEEADRIIPTWELDQLTTAGAAMRIQEERGAGLSVSYNETEEDNMTKEELAAAEARVAEIEAREKAVKDQEAAFAEATKKARATADAAFVADIVKQGRLPVGLQAQATVLFADLGDDSVTFGEGDAAQTMSPRAAFQDLLTKLPVPVETRELATGETVDFSDAAATADAITSEIARAKAAGQTITPAEAAGRIKRG